jgi:hypothetical protein
MFKKIAAVAALVLSSSAAFAAQPQPFYVGGDISSTKFDDADRETGFGVFAGYKFNETVAVEAGYHRAADLDVMVGSETVGVKMNQASLSVIGTLPLSNGFNVYGRLGYNRLEAKASYQGQSASDSTNEVLYGIGMGYSITPTIMARAELQKPSSDSTKMNVGVAFQF